MSGEHGEIPEMDFADIRKIYSETAIDHFMQPRNMGEMQDADGAARITGPCGDTMEIWIKVDGEIITVASFMTDGCKNSIASGSMATTLARGKSLSEAQQISQQDILQALDGLPEEGQHCALLASNTLKAAVQDGLAMLREPWKKNYRK